VGVKAAAVSVNWEITVLAADVRMAATSAVGSCSWGVLADPQAVKKMAISIRLRVGLRFMEPLYRLRYTSN
jgi:hypothetical protein